MTNQIIRVIGKGKVEAAKILLDKYYKNEDRKSWEAQLKAMYDALFPTTRNMVYEEYLISVNGKLYENELPLTESEYSAVETPFKVDIDYSLHLDYLPFNEWLNATNTVVDTVIKTDDLGVEYQEEIFEEQPIHIYTQTSQLDIDVLVNIYLTSKYSELRASEYPPMEDYLDAIVKNDTASLDEYIAKCQAVKAKYPKD